MDTEGKRRLDPRTGLLLLAAVNFVAFAQDCFLLEAGWITALAILLAVCKRGRSGVGFGLGFAALVALQRFVLPVSPKFIATSFSIFIHYARRMFPCLMVGSLMVRTITLREFIVGLRRLHVPQELIIPISVTLRYFPAIREEAGYIRDAMRLRNIRGLEKVEAMVVPLMISATGTAEELAAAAVTRGIENPAPKTSLVSLRMAPLDWGCLAGAACFAAAALIL